jgi:hypothetical protein
MTNTSTNAPKRHHGAALPGIVEINTRIKRDLAGLLPPLPPGAGRDKK